MITPCEVHDIRRVPCELRRNVHGLQLVSVDINVIICHFVSHDSQS